MYIYIYHISYLYIYISLKNNIIYIYTYIHPPHSWTFPPLPFLPRFVASMLARPSPNVQGVGWPRFGDVAVSNRPGIDQQISEREGTSNVLPAELTLATKLQSSDSFYLCTLSRISIPTKKLKFNHSAGKTLALLQLKECAHDVVFFFSVGGG